MPHSSQPRLQSFALFLAIVAVIYLGQLPTNHEDRGPSGFTRITRDMARKASGEEATNYQRVMIP
jgi:hypothetical protein